MKKSSQFFVLIAGVSIIFLFLIVKPSFAGCSYNSIITQPATPGCYYSGGNKYTLCGQNASNPSYSDCYYYTCDTGCDAKHACGQCCPGDPPSQCPCGNDPGGCSVGNCCDPNNYASPTYVSGGSCTSACNGSCNYWLPNNGSGNACTWQTSTCNVPPPIPVRGYKVQMPGNVQPAAGSTIDVQTVTAGGYASTANPYTISAPGSCTYPVNLNISAVIPPTYSVGYTQCNSTQANCTVNDTPASPNFYNAGIPQTGGNLWYNPGPGNTNAVTTISVAGTSATPTQNSSPSTVDLWWHYCSVWTNLGACQPPQGQTCGPGGTQIQTDNCGNTRTVACTTVCTFFQTFGGDVTFKGSLSNTQQPSGNYISGR